LAGRDLIARNRVVYAAIFDNWHTSVRDQCRPVDAVSDQVIQDLRGRGVRPECDAIARIAADYVGYRPTRRCGWTADRVVTGFIPDQDTTLLIAERPILADTNVGVEYLVVVSLIDDCDAIAEVTGKYVVW
jgi:hypothetical protein